MSTYFTEREGELPPRNNSEITGQFIEAMVHEVMGLADRGALARSFPLKCPEYNVVVIGTDTDRFWQATRAKLNLAANRPYDLVNEPNPLVVLNVIEFVHLHLAVPSVASRHSYFEHDHLTFQNGGQAEFREEANALFKRYGLAYQFTDDGTVIRLVPEEIAAVLVDAVFRTGDNELDELLNGARKKYLSPSADERREGLERLWDAFERLKTITVGKDKKAQITALIETAYTDADARTRLLGGRKLTRDTQLDWKFYGDRLPRYAVGL